jgi:hypothetical protein
LWGRWPPEIVEQAAVVWAVRERYRLEEGENKKRSKDQIEVIRRIVLRLDDDLVAIYCAPAVVGPFLELKIVPEDISTTFVSEDCDGLDLLPGAAKAEKAEYLNKLVISWIAAKKVLAFQFRGIESQIKRSKWLGMLIPAEIDLRCAS